MTAQDYLLQKIDEATGRRAPTYHLRAPQADKKGGLDLPQIIWRRNSPERPSGIDGVGKPIVSHFTIETRARTGQFAQNISDDILAALGDRMTHVTADFDEPDDVSQKRGDYFAHVISIGLTEHA